MERNYIAFISYRHLPLEMATAKRLHKRIERYVIPKELRKNGEKHPGLVFRDQDELPIACNLSDNIQTALDHSAFLIVICTPRTSGSPWVMREIDYFLEHHPRDHVLAVLAEGAPEESFPSQLTDVRSENGDLLQRIEPLAANIVADSNAKRWRLFRTESLRIVAALIGCHYDALFRRELRYRRRRAGIVAGICAATAGAFIAMLLNRNAEIRAQLKQSQINESKTLAALSADAWQEGDYDKALNYALSALPRTGEDRPYVPEAEYALSGELDLYRQGELSYTRSVEQETGIARLSLTSDGTKAATADEYGTLRLFDLEQGEPVWQRESRLNLMYAALDDSGALPSLNLEGVTLDILDDSLLYVGKVGIGRYRLADGEPVWERQDVRAMEPAALSPDGKTLLTTTFLHPEQGEVLRLIDTATGTDTAELPLTDGSPRYCPAACLNGAGLSALLLVDETGDRAELLLCDWNSGTARSLLPDLPYSAGAVKVRLCFTGDNDLLMAADDRNGTSTLRRFAAESDWDMVYETPIETEKVTLSVNSGGAVQLASLDLLDCRGDYVAVGCKHDLYMLSLATGEIRWHRTLPGNLLAARMYDNACLGLVLGDGTITMCTEEGYLSYTMDISCFRSGYTLANAALIGDSYPQLTAALVPDGDQQRMSVVRFVSNDLMYQVGAFSGLISHTGVVTSPSGALAFCIGYDPGGQAAEGVLMDAVEGSTGEVVTLSGVDGLDDLGKLYLTESGTLVTPRGWLDLKTMSDTLRTEQPGESAVTADGAILTAWLDENNTLHLYREGGAEESIPCPDGEWTLKDVGGSGTVLLTDILGRAAVRTESGEWQKLTLLPTVCCALGDTKPLMACWDGEQLTVTNLADGTVTTGAPLPPAVKKLFFACGDNLLFACSETGALSVVDTTDGSICHASRHGGLNLRFTDTMCAYRVAEAVGENRLLLFYDDLSRSESICLVLDRDVWACVGAFPNVKAYLPSRDSVLVCPLLDGVYLSPFRSRESIIETAQQRLAPPETGETE